LKRVPSSANLTSPRHHSQLTFVFDLLIADAATLSILSLELSKLYFSDSEAEAAQILPPLNDAATYRNFAMSKQRRLVTEAQFVREERAYWARKCSLEPEEGGLPICPQLPLRKMKGGTAFSVTRLSSSIPAEDWAKVLARCQKEGITANSLLFTAFVRVLATWSSNPHFLMNMAFFNRAGVFPDPADESRVVGNCASTMLVDCDLRHEAGKPALTLIELAARLQDSIFETVGKSTYTAGVDVMQDLNRRDKTPSRAVAPYVFASVLGMDQSSTPNPFNWFGKTPITSALTTPNVWIDQQVFDDVDGSVWYNWDVEPERFPDGLVEDLFKTYQSLLRRIVIDADQQDPGRGVWTMGIDAHNLVPEAHVALTQKFNANEVRPDLLAALQPLHRPLFDTALSNSTATAVVDGATGAEVSFSSLAKSAIEYAEQLEALIPNKKQPVPILLHKGAEQVVAVMAALVSGRAYVPLSTSWPEERILQIVDIVDAKVILTTKEAAEPYENGEVWQRIQRIDLDMGLGRTAAESPRKRQKSKDLDADTEAAGNAAHEVMHEVLQRLKSMERASPRELMRTAYIIFTSGSTGVPKGVTIRHEGASNTCIDCVERYGITSSDRVLSLASLSFDLSVFDLFGILAMAGGAIVMPDPDQEKFPEHWLNLMEQHQITLWNTAPPVMSMFLEYALHTPGVIERFRKLKLRCVMLSGDFISLTIPKHLHAMLPNCEVISMGGATEASIWSCWHRISRERHYQGSIPYGRALANQSLHVLSREDLRPVPILVEGEIMIGGVGLAAGYHNDVVKTDKAFVWSEHLRQQVYRTGDLGRVHPNGEVEILGRADFQLKINGYRIEIGDVEAALRAAEGVDEACVVPVGNGARKRLIGFLKCKDEVSAATIASSALASCKKRLPAYSQPSKIHLLDTGIDGLDAAEAEAARLETGREGSWPLSANGKVDRKMLKQFHADHEDGGADGAGLGGGGGFGNGNGESSQPPRTDTEKELCSIWESVLSTPVNNVHSNWFDLGGDSIKMIGAMSQLNAKFGEKLGGTIKSTNLMEHQTVSSLAAYIEGIDGVALSSGTDDAARLIVGMQRTGSLPPLFLIAPVSGTISCYRHLSKLLGPDQPFYALQHPGLEEGEEIFASVEEMAASMVVSIKATLATLPGGIEHGTFSLGGWSMGGVIACEVALQLLAEGVIVRSVVMIDSPAPSGTIDMGNLSTTAELALSYANDITAYRIESVLPTVSELVGLSNDDVEAVVLSALHTHEPALAAMTRDRFARHVAVYAANTRALANYTPATNSALFKTQVTGSQHLTLYLLRAETTNAHLSRYPGASSHDFGWRALGVPKSRLRVYAIRGDHYGLLGGGADDDATSVQIAHTLERVLPIAARRKQLRFKTRSVETLRHSMNTVERSVQRTSYSASRLGSADEPSHLAASLHRDKFKIESASTSLLDVPSSVDSMDVDGAAEEGESRVRLATADAYASLLKKLTAVPQFLCVAAAANVDLAALLEAIDGVVPLQTQVHVVSSCKGSLSADGLHQVTMMGISDQLGAYSTHYAPINTSSSSQWSELFEAGRAAGRAAAKAAWAKSGRRLEYPDLCIVNSTTGAEEGVLAGIADVVGSAVPCIGGSAADDGALDGGGWVGALSHNAPSGSSGSSGDLSSDGDEPSKPFIAKSTDDGGNGVVLTLMWPSVETRIIMASCYRPADPATGEDRVGTITKAEGRVIHEIDGKPAADVYGLWAGGADEMQGYQEALTNVHATQPTEPANVLGVTTLRPLGRVPLQQGLSGEAVEATSLIHPSHIMPGGGLSCFAAVQEGERIMMMEATKDDLIELMSEATKQEYAGDDIASFCRQLQGALAIYCGGCSLTVGQDRLSDLGTNVSGALSRKPFLTCFTYGEVGVGPLAAAAPSDGLGLERSESPQPQNCHANLMYSMLLFGAAKDRYDFDGERRLSFGGWTTREPPQPPLFRSVSSHEYGSVPFSLTYGLSRSYSHSDESEVHSTDI